MRVSTSPFAPSPFLELVVLHGAGRYVYLLSGDAYTPPTDTWTHYSLPLSTGNSLYIWWMSISDVLASPRRATDDDLRLVLSDLDGLSIYGDLSRGATDLDNVVLGAN